MSTPEHIMPPKPPRRSSDMVDELGSDTSVQRSPIVPPVIRPPLEPGASTLSRPTSPKLSPHLTPASVTPPTSGMCSPLPPEIHTPPHSAPHPSPSATTPQTAKQHRRAVTVEEALYGDWRKYAHLDQVIREVTQAVQETIVETGRAPDINKARTDDVFREMFEDEIESLTLGELYKKSIPTEERYRIVESVQNEIIGLGPLEPLWHDPTITEVMANGPDTVYVEQYGTLFRATGIKFRNAAHLKDICERILLPLNRKLDIKEPLQDGRLPDGSRVNAVHPVVAPAGPFLTVRRFPNVNRTLADLVELGSVDKEMACTLAWLVKNEATTLVSGGTGSGKLLTLTTPIPVPPSNTFPDGWSTMGDLNVGDQVFGRNGLPCTVTFLSHIDPTPDLYTVTFTDGQTLTADADHQWVVSAFNADGMTVVEEEVLTTRTMIQRWDETPAHPITNAKFAIRLPSPVHYSAPSPFTATMNHTPASPSPSADTATYAMSPYLYGTSLTNMFTQPSPHTQRIHVRYLHGSIAERYEVVKGLTDMAGHSDNAGHHTLTLTHPHHHTDGMSPTITTPHVCSPPPLINDVVHLLRSLGLPTTHTTITTPTSSTATTTITFTTPTPALNFTHTPTDPDPAQWVGIVSITPAPTEPGRCIQVDSPDSTYLAGGYLPTHNTTMLNSLSACIPRNERIITIEDSLELRLHPESHIAALEARPSDSSGFNSITIRKLVVNALRMRPDRIVVGEVRDEAALEMLNACNTGHEGSMSTIHANGADETVARLAVMIAQGGEFPANKVDWLIGAALDIIVVVERGKDGRRRVEGIYEVPTIKSGQDLITIPLWKWHRTGTNPDTGEHLGEYRKHCDISEDLTEKLGLEWDPILTWEELLPTLTAPVAPTPHR